jgi:hypothetical protein
MQLTTLSVAFFAGLAYAHQHAPHHFHNRRQLNTTAEQTTLTVYATSIYTVTSCAASITNCPARASGSTSEIIVTDVIQLTTTVCPVLEAESASSAIIAAYTSSTASAVGVVSTPGSASTVSAPLGAGVSAVASTTPALPVSTAAGIASSSAPIGTGVSTVSAVVSSTYSISTIYETSIYTITSCAATVTNCPARIGSVTTEVNAVSTTSVLVASSGAPSVVLTYTLGLITATILNVLLELGGRTRQLSLATV